MTPLTDGISSEIANLEEAGGAASYARDIRGIVRALWAGTMDYDQAGGMLINTIRLGVERAFYEGAKSVGVLPADLSPAEKIAILDITVTETSFVPGFLTVVYAGRKNGPTPVKLGSLMNRAQTWGLRYADVVNRARVAVGADKKLRWTINYTRVVKENCPSCLKLDGKTKRASFWEREDVHPQNPPNDKLICEGYVCGCALVPTDEPCTPGPLPSLP